MDDLTIVRLCAEALALKVKESNGRYYFDTFSEYDPLHSKGQALELVIALRLEIARTRGDEWLVLDYQSGCMHTDPDLLRAICTCAAQVQRAKEQRNG